MPKQLIPRQNLEQSDSISNEMSLSDYINYFFEYLNKWNKRLQKTTENENKELKEREEKIGRKILIPTNTSDGTRVRGNTAKIEYGGKLNK